MPILRNPKYEIVAQELAAGKKPEEASATLDSVSGKPIYDTSRSSFAANARKRAQRKDIRARVKEIQGPGAERAGLTSEYMLSRLRSMTDGNLDDYLTSPDEYGRRFFDIGHASREHIGRLCQLQIDESTEGRGKNERRAILKTKLKLHDPIAAMTLGARLQGMLRDRMDVTSKDKELAPVAIQSLSNTQLEALINRIGVAID